MKKVTVIGSGNVAEGFSVAISESRLELVEVAGRNRERLDAISKLTGCNIGDLNALKEADIYILAVSDDAVGSIAEQIERYIPEGSIVVHCAGSVGLDCEAIDGVIYPMQTFTAGRRVNFYEVPLFIEARDESNHLSIIKEVAEALSDRVFNLDSEQRRYLHLGAVFACNFTNAMLTACSEVLEPSGVSLDIYKPLVEETIAKAFAKGNTPQKAQTGAARRGDLQTQAKHIEMLREMNDEMNDEMEGEMEMERIESDNLAEIYQKISKYIWETSKRI